MSERSSKKHNTSSDQEVAATNTAPDPSAEAQPDKSNKSSGETEFGKQSDKVIAETVGALALNLHK